MLARCSRVLARYSRAARALLVRCSCAARTLLVRYLATAVTQAAKAGIWAKTQLMREKIKQIAPAKRILLD